MPKYLYSSCSVRRSEHTVLIFTVGWVVWVRDFRSTSNLQEHVDQSEEKTGSLHDGLLAHWTSSNHKEQSIFIRPRHVI